MRSIFKRNQANHKAKTTEQVFLKQQGPNLSKPTILSETLEIIRKNTGNSTDLIIRQFQIDTADVSIDAAIVYLDGMADSTTIMDSLLIDGKETGIYRNATSDNLIQKLKSSLLKVGDIKTITDMDSIHIAIFSGDAIVLVDGSAESIAAGVRKWSERGVTEPQSQTVIRGPREGFSESIRINTALVRRKIKDPNLWLETNPIGRISKTDVAIMFIKGIANEKVVNEVRIRLARIDTDAILESGYIEEFIQDETYTPFPTIYNTERPDVVAAGLLEGRVAILVDGTPFVLLAPALFTQFLQTAEDYYQRADISSLLRILRFVSLFIALFAPSIYIAITTFHQEMIPTPLLINFAAQREGIPFPAFVEAILMEVTFEILREAGVRMPRAVGQAVSIVGALVIGQAAVEAGLVGPTMVIIVSITAISNFVIPSYSLGISVRMMRFILMMLAASFGLFGILVGIIALVLHLCSLRSFGIPYMSPFGPLDMEDQNDNLIRLPHWLQHRRPRYISQGNEIREKSTQPKPPEP
ncbi:spore germination protein KA [Paenibacillus endophyticus]|uniref:Spore germination protein KA n=1 Tax=Paenibacillus endophyticus TaxID=1294268 RepID=A0A7W5G9I0_9BACL|nr:spore germination protein [Paenibacillus endophyticus]MBB3151735.1 spore germination protein KA [Paenibacillus endophyticus]